MIAVLSMLAQLAYTNIDIVWLLGIILLVVGVVYLIRGALLVGLVCIIVGLFLIGGGVGFR